MSQWDEWHTTVELTGTLCELCDFELAHQALRKLDEREMDALYSAVLDFKALCKRHPLSCPSFEAWIEQKALEVER